ncbi:MAG: protein-disulfide reductase DsbD family protein [Parvularculaceae bacterium]
MSKLICGLAGVAAAVFFAVAANAASPALSDTVVTEHATTKLSSARDALAPGRTIALAFRQKLEPGWHVYWRNPGDSGLPLELNWTLPDGVTASDVAYPAPERVPAGPFVNFGHHGEPTFVVSLTAAPDLAVGDTLEIGLNATWLICEEICVPESGSFTLSLPVAREPAPVPEVAAAIEAARAAAPQPFAGEALARVDGGVALSTTLDGAPEDFESVFFFPETEGLIEPSAAQVVTSADGRLRIDMTAGPGFDEAREAVDAVRGVLSFETRDGARAFDVDASIRNDAAVFASAAPTPIATRGSGAGDLFALIGLAFLGGLILNAMPCVFPIIFVKAASFVDAASGARAEMRAHGLFYTAGVVATFALLGGLLLALRAGGAELGWGFHLQSPPIVAASAYVLFLVGLNLAGVFHVGENLQNVGSDLAAKGGRAGAFFTGALAVFVAAPCIGPLLSAPMGAAVLLPPFAGMLIFVAMALGLAAPFAVLSFAPALAKRLPRPGAWMETFKQALSFPVFAAAAFFLWVLAEQTGPQGLAVGLAGGVLLAAAAWAFEKAKGRAVGGARAFQAAAALAALAAIVPAAGLDLAAPSGGPAKGGYGRIEAAADDPAALDAARTEGRGGFVDFTAAWCVTCQVNKATILSRASVADLFETNDVALMAADWTRRDPDITAALEAFGANGVPLYVYYPPAGAPKVLPLPLTEGAIRRHLSGEVGA